MKRFLVVMMAAIFLLGVMSCGKKTTDDGKGTNAVETAETVETATADTNEAVEAVDEGPVEVEETAEDKAAVKAAEAKTKAAAAAVVEEAAGQSQGLE